MTGPAYPAARAVAETARAHFARHLAAARAQGSTPAAEPDASSIEAIINAGFWASLRREEGFSPKISLALVPPERAGAALKFERRMPLTPGGLAKLAPAVERPGIHLGVWPGDDGLCVWGTMRTVPRLSFVLEVIEPGLLVVKHRGARDPGKFVNVAVLKGDQIKVIDEHGASLPDCPGLLDSLIGFGSPEASPDAFNLLVQLAVSMRAHGRGGSLLVVPSASDAWKESIVRPVPYVVEPAYKELSELMRRRAEEWERPAWQEALIDAVDAVAGLTAVDGATIICDSYELVAFGAKIGRREGGRPVEQVSVTEPVVGNEMTIVHPLQFGGTRHLSAAQFAHDQHDALALVASQDGRFTVFAWSPCEEMVHGHRVETLLL